MMDFFEDKHVSVKIGTESGSVERSVLSFFSEILDNMDSEILELNRSISEIENSELKSTSSELRESLKVFYYSYRRFHKVLLEDFKESYVLTIKDILNSDKIASVGSRILRTGKIWRAINGSAIVNSIDGAFLKYIEERVLKTPPFKYLIGSLKHLYHRKIEERIRKELESLPIDVEPDLVESYRKEYYKNPLTFEQFLELRKKEDARSKHAVSESGSGGPGGRMDSSAEIRKRFEKALEKKKIDELKKKQLESFDNYQKYFEMDERELKRLRRTSGKPKRKYQTKRRRLPPNKK